ncbi:MAG: MerR family DNA-binding transcriptional regulator [Moorea sp. SIO3I7]|nr:MerR family DNA-binding transcriptional regulator [Moorena sp. SIO3I7]
MRFLTARKAAKELNIPESTIKHWGEEGMIQTISDRNNTKRYDLDSLASKKNQERLARMPTGLDPYRPLWVFPKEARKALGVAQSTLIDWDKAGKIKTRRTKGNYRQYDLNSIKLSD